MVLGVNVKVRCNTVFLEWYGPVLDGSISLVLGDQTPAPSRRFSEPLTIHVLL